MLHIRAHTLLPILNLGMPLAATNNLVRVSTVAFLTRKWFSKDRKIKLVATSLATGGCCRDRQS